MVELRISTTLYKQTKELNQNHRLTRNCKELRIKGDISELF